MLVLYSNNYLDFSDYEKPLKSQIDYLTFGTFANLIPKGQI